MGGEEEEEEEEEEEGGGDITVGGVEEEEEEEEGGGVIPDTLTTEGGGVIPATLTTDEEGGGCSSSSSSNDEGGDEDPAVLRARIMTAEPLKGVGSTETNPLWQDDPKNLENCLPEGEIDLLTGKHAMQHEAAVMVICAWIDNRLTNLVKWNMNAVRKGELSTKDGVSKKGDDDDSNSEGGSDSDADSNSESEEEQELGEPVRRVVYIFVFKCLDMYVS
jgi:hypothetical protein